MIALVTPVLTSALGAGLGYGWFRLVGCRSGTCVITSRWWTSALYGAMMGWMLGANPG